MKVCGGLEVNLHLTLALDSEWSSSRSGHFTSEERKNPDARCLGPDVVARGKVTAPAGNRTPVLQSFASHLVTDLSDKENN
jgi:hypothetical protein